MPWQPRHNLAPTAPLRDNLLAFLQAHFEEALEWARLQCNLGAPLPAPDSYNLDRAVRARYPVVNALMMGGDPNWTDGGDIAENKRILVEVETQAANDADLAKVLEPYVLAVRSMATEMEERDWFKGMSMASRGDLLVRVGSERYGDRSYDSEDTFTRVGSVIIEVEYLENERS